MIKLIKHDYFFIISIIALIALSIVYPNKIPYYPHYVDWETIIVLSGLFLITTGLKESFFFSFISRKLITRVKYERSLGLVLVLTTAIFSSFLTNDISIMIMIPLTLSLKEKINNDINKIIVLEIIAANIGSLLTPIGNPQNIYIWHKYGLTFFNFTLTMLPLEIILILLLLGLARLVIRKKPLIIKNNTGKDKIRKPLLLVSLLSLIGFITLIEFKLSGYGLITLAIIYLLFFRRVVIKIDWSIIMLFIFLFIDIHVISEIEGVKSLILSLNITKTYPLFLAGILSSQAISNVPATFLLSQYTTNWKVLAYSVNIGGNGTLISSLANVIALKLNKTSGIIKDFHILSFLFLILSAVAGYIILLLF